MKVIFEKLVVNNNGSVVVVNSDDSERVVDVSFGAVMATDVTESVVVGDDSGVVIYAVVPDPSAPVKSMLAVYRSLTVNEGVVK